nr:putative nuclease HARBI1 [Dermacentor andersoni]
MAAPAVQSGAHHESRGDSGYRLEPWLLTPVPGHPPVQTAKGQYNTGHAAMRSVVGRCIGLLKSCFRCLQRYRTLLCEPERAANIVAACAVLHNLRLSEGDKESDDDSDDDGRSSSSKLDGNGDPIPHGLPQTRGLGCTI